MTERTGKAAHQTRRLRRRNRAAIVTVIAWLLLAHTLFAVHRIDHFTGDAATCAMCVAAHHAGGPIQEPLHAIATPEPEAVAVEQQRIGARPRHPFLLFTRTTAAPSILTPDAGETPAKADSRYEVLMQLGKRAALFAALLTSMSGPAFSQGQVSGNEFNPAISLILDGHYASYSLDPATYELPGFLLDAEAGLPSEGLSLDETELAISANVDDKYYGFLTAALEQTDGETSVELEEAYVETLALPKGLKVKGGRFLSDIGYLNPIHAHAWDFNDAPLAYVAMLNTAYKDDGIQLRWVVPASLLIEIGGEILRGDSFPGANGAASDGTGASTLFVHVGGDVGSENSWRAGLAHLSTDANERASVFADGSAAFTGSSDLTIADFVWKWAKNGNPQRSLLHRPGRVSASSRRRRPRRDDSRDGRRARLLLGTQDGFYVQGVYQFRPRWRAGVRFDRLDASNDFGRERADAAARRSPAEPHQRDGGFLEQRIQPLAAAIESRSTRVRRSTINSSSSTS